MFLLSLIFLCSEGLLSINLVFKYTFLVCLWIMMSIELNIVISILLRTHSHFELFCMDILWYTCTLYSVTSTPHVSARWCFFNPLDAFEYWEGQSDPNIIISTLNCPQCKWCHCYLLIYDMFTTLHTKESNLINHYCVILTFWVSTSLFLNHCWHTF